MNTEFDFAFINSVAKIMEFFVNAKKVATFFEKLLQLQKKYVFLQKILVPDTAYRIKVIGDDTFDSAY